MPNQLVFVIMGVSGSGKTTVGEMLAGRLGWGYAEADAFHSEANLAKMASGHPLDDADRGPWLAAIARWIDDRIARGVPGVVTCSALKRAYRDILRRPQVQIVYLAGAQELIARRLAARHGHFGRVTNLVGVLPRMGSPGVGARRNTSSQAAASPICRFHENCKMVTIMRLWRDAA